MARIVELIYSTEREGKGVEADPVRIIHTLWTKDGAVVARFDPCDKNETVVTTKIAAL